LPLRDLTTTIVSNEKAEFAKLVDASVTMGADPTLAMGKKKLAAAVVKLSGSGVILSRGYGKIG
jgi:hypothetical protein